MNNKTLHMVAFILLVVGGLNWLLVGAFGMNLVEELFGPSSALSKTVYVLVGLSAIYEILGHKRHCTTCSVKQTA